VTRDLDLAFTHPDLEEPGINVEERCTTKMTEYGWAKVVAKVYE
jgi:hypothetical protein